MPLACQPSVGLLEDAEGAPPGACCQVASKPPKEQENHENPAKTRQRGAWKISGGPLPYGMPQKRPFWVGTKLFTSRKRRRAARPSGRRTLRYSSSLTKKARSKLGQFNFFRTLTSHGPPKFSNPHGMIHRPGPSFRTKPPQDPKFSARQTS